MENIYMLSDTEITNKISAKLKELRLKQNISRQDLAMSSGVSLSSIVRMEDGDIKSFDSFLRILRMLGKIDVILPLVEDEQISPNEYFKMVEANAKKRRMRASKSKGVNKQEDSEW
ncbi:MAG: helix-turn-helix domain-containing protein [Paludibacteraceae bacterium]|nr:helix-turn-helix domain-containing protein [Paludibacteraceae bacterium]